MRQRLAPFLDLLDARYLPLLFVAAPQAYTVYAWLLSDGAPQTIAVLGAIGFESVYVGAIAWAERGAGWRAARVPAVASLLFSVAVAVAHYGPDAGALAVLHAGFPIVGYAYMVLMHQPRQAVDETVAQDGEEADALRAALTQARAEMTQTAQEADAARQRASAAEAQAAELRHRLAARATQPADEYVNVNGEPWSVRQLAARLEVSEATLRRKLKKEVA